MSETKKPITKSVYRPDFEIPQFVKMVGLRQTKQGTNMSRFTSPIFGNKVMDNIVIPKSEASLGDTTKRLDAFRVKPKQTKEEILRKNGTEYPEFNILSNKARAEYLGGKIVDDNEQDLNKEVVQETKRITPITNNSHFEKVEEKPAFEYESVRAKNINLEASIKKDEPTIDNPGIGMFKKENTKVFSGSFGIDNEDDFSFEEKEVKEIVIPKTIKNIPKPKSRYMKPPVTMFKKLTRDKDETPEWLLNQIEIINKTLTDFGIEGEVIGSTKGPTVTRYEIALKPGVNVNRISNLSDNLMMNLQAKTLRIEAPIPGKPYVGLEVPNVNPEIVAFGNVVDDPKFLEAHDKPLQVALGVDIDGNNVYVDIAKMPHGLIAGATNSGKSVCINTVLASLLIKNSPEELKLILIDPKMVELIAYNDLPHLITPVITDAKMASQALKWAVEEMEKRYKLFADNRSRDIKGFNDNVKAGRIDSELMPYMVIVIDELADLMMVAANDVEDAIQRITQKARAAGIHLIVATQRPTTDVVKGTIKSNIPTRIAFKVASFVDSTTILDGAGAENLLGKGDMLLKEVDRPFRLQGAYIPDDEIYQLTDYIRDNSETNYTLDHEELKNKAIFKETKLDEYFTVVAEYVVETGSASINAIIKEFSISFNRAQAIVNSFEGYGIVSENLGTKAREVLVNISELRDILGEIDV